MTQRCIAYGFPCKMEIRQSESRDGSATVFGIAVPYGQLSQPIYGYFQEKFERGAFTECLAKKPDIVCSIDHNWGNILGRVSADNLRIQDKEEGLYVECELNNTTYASDLLKNLRSKNVRGMSFTFDSITDQWAKVEGMPTRTVSKAKLYEVCFTSNPAYLQTTAGARNAGLYTPEDVEALVAEKLGETPKRVAQPIVVTDDMKRRYEKMKRIATGSR